MSGNISHISNDPWQLALYNCFTTRSGSLCGCRCTCGASLILPKWAITAGHCVPINPPNRVPGGLCEISYRKLYYGKHVLNYDGISHNRASVEIEAVALYPTYGKDEFWLANDVALLRLKYAVPTTPYSRPICLHNVPFNDTDDTIGYEDYECRATGYGAVNFRHSGSLVLMSTSQKIVHTGKALTFLKDLAAAHPGILPHGQMTVGQWLALYKYAMFTVGVSGTTCQGDSGGPLVCRKSSEHPWELFGITSWGFGCMKNTPNAFTRINSHFAWIWQVVAAFDDDARIASVDTLYSGRLKNLTSNVLSEEPDMASLEEGPRGGHEYFYDYRLN